MIVVVTGSQKFQFDRLLKRVDELLSEGFIDDEVFAQSGCSNYVPKNYKCESFLDKDKLADKIEQADVIITHGGTGVIVNAVKNGKKVIAVPRLSRYGEHVDDHQVQLIEEFAKQGLIEPCYEVENLGKALTLAKKKKYRRYVSNADVILKDVDRFILSKLEVKK